MNNPIKQLRVQAFSQSAIKADIAKDEISHMSSAVGWELWLPFAARELELSSDPKDYLIHPVPIMYSDLPNRNGFAFPLNELIKWNVELGRQAYKGWSGMPMYTEHQSEDHKKALGVVIDTSMRRIQNFVKGKFWKVLALAAIDRNKHPKRAEQIEKGEVTTYSMGAMVDYCTCSFCGAIAGQCGHVKEDNNAVTFYEKENQLVFKNVHGVRPYELSVVDDCAYNIAQHTVRLDYELGTVVAPNLAREDYLNKRVHSESFINRY